MTTKRPLRTEDAIAALEARGFTVLKTKSYIAAQRRQGIAEAEAMWAKEDVESSRLWARNCLEKERQLTARCTYLYGLASRHGATDDELRSP